MVQGETPRGQRLARTRRRGQPVHARRPGRRRYRLGVHLLPQLVSRGPGSAGQEGGTLPFVPVGQIPGVSWQRGRAVPRKWASVSRKSASTSALNTMRISRSVTSGSPESLPSSQAGRGGGAACLTSGMSSGSLLDRRGPPRLPVRVRRRAGSFFRAAPAGRPPWWPLTAAANTPDRPRRQPGPGHLVVDADPAPGRLPPQPAAPATRSPPCRCHGPGQDRRQDHRPRNAPRTPGQAPRSPADAHPADGARQCRSRYARPT